MKIEIFDTTLRDGAQSAGVEFSPDDKIRTILELDSLGVSYIEAGMITSRADREFFQRLGEVGARLGNARLCVFCRTAKAGERAEDDEYLNMSAESPVPTAVIYGKASLNQTADVLGVSPEENLRMISDSVSLLARAGKEVIFDAEHFFDGYSDNPAYASLVVDTAFRAGASRVVLCDTNGGMLPDVIGLITRAVREKYNNIGVHCHNDLGMAVSCSVSAVLEGASQVHGTITGIGERCGNADLCTLIPVLQLKLGFDCIGERIKNLTHVARSITNAANLTFDEKSPFVGGYAFTHKAGAHIDGVKKSPKSFEHIPPEAVGNRRNIVISGLSGRAALLDKLRAYLPEEKFTKDDERVVRLMRILKEKEALGYDYEDAGASFALLIDEALGRRREFFRLLSLKVMTDEREEVGEGEDFHSSAIIKISVGGKEELSAGEGNGPVNAIDSAFRRAITHFYPEVSEMRLTDYRVRVLNSRATASKVRVAIESTDGVSVWRTTGVSSDVINASWQALRDSVEYMMAERGCGELR